MSSKVSVASIALSQLDSSSLLWISKIAHVLKKQNGVHLELNDQFILGKVVDQVRRSNNAEAKDLYRHLKASLRAHINSDDFDTTQLNTVSMDEWRASRYLES